MSNEQTPLEGSVDQSDDLDLFSADFFGQNQQDPEPTKSVEDETPEKVDALTDDAHTGDDDTPDTEDETEDEVQEESKPAPKKNRFQERIDEVVGKQREAERRAAELEQKLTDTLARLDQQKPAKAPVQEETGEPQPTDTYEDGTEKYPLGEFDPQYIRDLTKHALASERKAMNETETKQREQEAAQAEAQVRATTWESKLGPARERYPDFNDKVGSLIDSFNDLDSGYSEYLTEQFMDMDAGTEVLYYLSTHPDEARAIVNSGARKATLALGALEERLRPRSEEEKPVRKVSKAPTPPPTNKGAAVASIEVPDDTDDLDAFSKKLFKKR